MDFRKRKRTISGSATLQTDPSSRQKVHDLFEKKFSYSKPSDDEWEVPDLVLEDTELHKWESPDIEVLKSTLNNVKDQLSDKDITLWHEHTNFMNPAGTVMKELQSRFRPELCTQAWCKFYEIVSSYDLVDMSWVVFNSVHLCEAPGAFITSLNHYLHANGFSGFWHWIGTTLNPYHEGNSTSEMINDDRFIQNSLENWDFGVDGTGNIMKWYNVQHLLDRCRAMEPIQLVTCDGSIDCQDMPADQETVVSSLHCCEALAAMLILAPGGALVLKKFTMFEGETSSLMYLLNCCFKQVDVFKPATSKSGNSEVYVICRSFHGDQTKIATFSKLYFTNEDSTKGLIFPQEKVPASFHLQHKLCCERFVALQRSAISNNLDHYPSVSEHYMLWMDCIRDCCAEHFISKYHVTKIPGSCHLMQTFKRTNLSKEDRKECSNLLQKMHSGTFRDRQKMYAIPWDQKVHHLMRYDDVRREIIWCKTLKQNITEKEVQKWARSEENRVTFLASSMFCEPRLLKLTQEIFQKAQIQKHQESVNQGCSLATINDVLRIMTATTNCSERLKFSVVILLDDESKDCFMNSDSHMDHKLCKNNMDKEGNISVRSTGEELPAHSNMALEDSLIDKVLYRTYASLQSPVCEGNTVFYIDLCPPVCTCETEIQNQPHLIHGMFALLQKMQPNDTLMIQLTPCLTRFTAGLVYLLCHCFLQVGFLSNQEPASFRQVLICYQYTELPYWFQHHQKYIQDNVRGQQTLTNCDGDCNKTEYIQNSGEFYDLKNKILLETVPMQVLSSDFQFMMSMRRSNAALLRSFVNTVGDRERELYSRKTDS